MSDTIGLREARAQLGKLVRKTSASRERTAITDHGQVAAVLVNPRELADLEDELALTRHRLEQATNTAQPTTPHEDVVREVRGQQGSSAA